MLGHANFDPEHNIMFHTIPEKMKVFLIQDFLYSTRSLTMRDLACKVDRKKPDSYESSMFDYCQTVRDAGAAQVEEL